MALKMTFHWMWLVLLLQSGYAGASIEQGVSMADTISVNGKELLLNGMGTRKATIFNVKVYVAGLYLQTKSQDPETILNSKEIKKVDLRFLHDVPKNKLVDAWTESFEKNCKVNCEELKPKLKTLSQNMADLVTGDSLSFVFGPESVEVSVKNGTPQTIAGREFSKLLLMSWLGPNPPNADLKMNMLGKRAEAK